MTERSPIPLLFLVADTGGGHRASATAVARQLAAVHGETAFDVAVVDPFAERARWPLNQASNVYGPLIRRAPWLWGAAWHATNSATAVTAMRGSILRSLRPGLGDLLRELHPAVVVSFHPLLNHVAAQVMSATLHPVPLLTVITDLYDVHASWMCTEVDAVVTPSPSGLDRCRRAGVPATRCYDFGIPVDPSFTTPARLSAAAQRALRGRLGLDRDGFTLLLVGGGDGSGDLEKRTRALAEADLDVRLVVICGRNRTLQHRLEGLTSRGGHPVCVQGFVGNMAEWTHAADVVVSKAGPGTIAESLCCGVPLLLTWFIPGQERGNIDFVLATGCGRYVPHIGELIDTVAELGAPGSRALATLREAVRHAARPDATARIAELIASYATPATALVPTG